MRTVLATGGWTVDPRSGRIDVTPLVAIVAAIVVVRFALGIRLRWPVVGGAVLGGVLLGAAIQVWGVGVPSAVALAAGVVVTTPIHRRARRRRESQA